MTEVPREAATNPQKLRSCTRSTNVTLKDGNTRQPALGPPAVKEDMDGKHSLLSATVSKTTRDTSLLTKVLQEGDKLGSIHPDCLVKRNFTVPHPEVFSLVSYISMRSSVKFVFSFLDKKFKETRDAVILTNFKIIYNKTRNSITKTSNQDLAKLIPEGWNRIIVTLTGRYLTVTLVQPEGHVLLYTQHFDYDVTEIYGEGDVTRCSEAAPVFDVPEGEEVPVQLWPEGSKQFIKLLPGNSTDLYFKFPGEAKNYSVPSNSTLLISTSFQGDQTMLEVFKVTDEGDRKLIGNSTVPINTIMSPIFGGGPAQLRLTKVPECCNSSLAAPVTTPPVSRGRTFTSMGSGGGVLEEDMATAIVNS
ncbi:hypothetical protein E2C01_000440 [Portunus trituberculatus]|uniref:Uncharacterized protein n=1 Tax=Portunus trituberculatus TaxID=210409 RepID=A0A5B7CF67_PORTR|nr:hypothetical protein [Portunus trituberculatus]